MRKFLAEDYTEYFRITDGKFWYYRIYHAGTPRDVFDWWLDGLIDDCWRHDYKSHWDKFGNRSNLD